MLRAYSWDVGKAINQYMDDKVKKEANGTMFERKRRAINIETRRSTTPEKRVILVQGPC